MVVPKVPPKPVVEETTLLDILSDTQALEDTPSESKKTSGSLDSDLSGVLDNLGETFSETGTEEGGSVGVKVDKLNTRGFSKEEREVYYQRLRGLTEDLWKVPPNMTQTDLVVSVRFRIKTSGEIVEFEMEQLSGNEDLDKSVKNLLKVLQRLPALPESYPDDRLYEIGLRFNPQQFQF